LSHLPQARVANLTRAIGRLHDEGFTVVGLDERAEATIYERACPPGRVAVVLGGEGSGISRLVREHCDLLVSLPMRGKVESLNAAAALAAVLYAYVLASRGSESHDA
jgi:23S rRNA (guanosine2251-2'-O)-methyltransferase